MCITSSCGLCHVMPTKQEINIYMSLIASTWSINSLCTSASDTINITVPLGMRWSPASDFRSLGAVGLNFITFHPPMGHTLLIYSNSSLAGYHPLFCSNRNHPCFWQIRNVSIFVSILTIVSCVYIYTFFCTARCHLGLAELHRSVPRFTEEVQRISYL